MQRARSVILYLLAAVGLTLLFWLPLWRGGGFIGGDLYPYFLPQKLFLSERLQAGEFPLWNSWTGHGYPLLAESQTGALYPLHLLCYGLLDVNTAYNAVHLLHYVLAFLFAALYARRFGLRVPGALLTALVYTYGWFPPRSALEWAIIGGAWFAAALWCAESFLQTRHWRYGIGLAAALGLQMLAGHYNLAFITQLVLVLYVPGRLWWATERLPDDAPSRRSSALAAALAALACGFALAAVQLLPSWELKELSQRETVGAEHDPGYGHIPPLYWSQIIAPWLWYSPEIDADRALNNLGFLSIPSATNKVEAHLYFGLVPFGLILCGLAMLRSRNRLFDRRHVLWVALGLLALIYTAGWLLVVTVHLPGFSFFHGPGRYGIVTTFAAALLAGTALDAWLGRLRPRTGAFVAMCVFALTVGDLWLVSRLVTYTTMLDDPPIAARDESDVARILASHGQPVRIYGPGQNVLNLLQVAAVPVYLGLGPAAYYDPELTLPPGPSGPSPIPVATPEQIDWLRRAGVTHVLSFEPLDPASWPARPVWQGYDRLLNPAWHRYTEPLFLYELEETRGRIAWAEPGSGQTAEVLEYRANRVTARVASETGGRVVLTDLAWPGWEVSIDGEPARAETFEGMYRSVEVPPGGHALVWRYHPQSVRTGAIVSLCALFLLAAVGHVRYWHPGWLVRGRSR